MENTHDGHRQRIRARALSGGIESLQPHELVEYLLFFAIPRRNTNPLAHRLLEQFGTLQSLFSADVTELLQVEGMTASSAEWLHLAGRAILCYAAPAHRQILLRNRRQTRRFLVDFYQQPGVDGCWLLCLNASGCLIHTLPLNLPGAWHSPENLRNAIAQALRCRAHTIILAQQRDDVRLSEREQHRTLALMHSLSRIHIALVEHVILDRAGTDYIYATNPEMDSVQIAEQSDLLAHWLDEV